MEQSALQKDGLWQRISQHPLEDLGGPGVFAAKLRRCQRWSAAYCARAIADYRRFCYLAVRSQVPLSPSPSVDLVWHHHLTYTRDYWTRFCPDVLGASLHHEPAGSNSADRADLAEQYARTLQRYQDVFGVPPDDELWPTYREQERQVRNRRHIDISRYWLLRRPRWDRWRWWMVVTALLPGGLHALPANPLHWPGPEFLSLFVVLMAGTAIACAVIGRRLRDLGPAVARESLTTDELAFLVGGAERVVDITAHQLEQRQVLFVEGGRLCTAPAATALSPLEAALLAVCTLPRAPAELVRLLAPQLHQIGVQLERRRLWLDAGQMMRMRWMKLLPLGGLWLLGAAKTSIGLQHDRPVLWLALLMIVLSLSLLVVLLERDRRSTAGRQLVRDCLRQHATLQRASTVGDQRLAVALFGLGALTAAGVASAYSLLRHPAPGGGATSATDASSGDHGGSNDGNDSDSGGSGCGGCGGGGGD